jgi:rfaE bifunctional protein kinase chain/domain
LCRRIVRFSCEHERITTCPIKGEAVDFKRVKEILQKIQNVRIAIYGDFCIDAYLILDPHGSEISVETGLQAEAVKTHYYSLGGASNVVANLVALKPAEIRVIGVIGDDIYGRELERQFRVLGADIHWLIIQKENFDTYTYGKRYLGETEKPRIDFGIFNKRTEETDETLLKGIRETLQQYDVLIFNQQIPNSITNPGFINRANRLFEEFGDKIVLLDTRHFGDQFREVYRKTNDIEAARLNQISVNDDDCITLSDIEVYAEALYRRSRKPVFITRGSRGMIAYDNEGLHDVPGIQLLKKLDPVGAGDTISSALALCLGAGTNPHEAAIFANLAAGVTIQKLYRTGTASPEELVEISRNPDYVFQPELAENHRYAHYYHGTDIELCYRRGMVHFGGIKYAVIDHDGTISTLRQGWESIMEPVMIEAIAGDALEQLDESVYKIIRDRVREYIDKSTGVQTIVQMEALVEMVREFGLVKETDILDISGYKKLYNRALMGMVEKRKSKLKKGERDIYDFTLKGALRFLEALREKGVALYLFSGTDQPDTQSEAEILGYAKLFNGGIYGALGDIKKFSKRMVLESIMNENNLKGNELVVFGDGPVEIRECRRRSGIAVGVASDEVRRYGLNREKRARLIKAGAQMVIPDFSQLDTLMELLFP